MPKPRASKKKPRKISPRSPRRVPVLIRFPDWMLTRIDVLAEELGWTRTAAVVEAVARFNIPRGVRDPSRGARLRDLPDEPAAVGVVVCPCGATSRCLLCAGACS